MTKLPFSLFLLLAYLALTYSIQITRPSSPTSSSNGGDRNTQVGSVKTGRAINSNSGAQNRVTTPPKNVDEDIEMTDSAFDNSPQRTDSSALVFPEQTFFSNRSTVPRKATEVVPPPPAARNRWQKIPLNVLLGLGLNETKVDFEKLFKHVANVRVEHDQRRQQKYLTDKDGQPLKDDANALIVISRGPPSPVQTNLATRVNNDYSISGAHPLARNLPGRIFNDIADSSPSRGVYEAASSEICVPELTTVPLPATFEPYLTVIPKCARVKRCGGCCLSENLACVPMSTHVVNVTVQKFRYNGDASYPLDWHGKEDIEIEEHTRCSCQCKYRPEHCNKFQEYRKQECSCACKNEDAKRNCYDNDKKVWDESSCMCTCREFQECSSGQYFDLNVCSCKDDKSPKKSG